VEAVPVKPRLEVFQALFYRHLESLGDRPVSSVRDLSAKLNLETENFFGICSDWPDLD
jgi:hypothetical protein